MGIKLTITSQGEVVLGQDILEHLGADPGKQVGVERLPGARIEMRVVSAGEISAVFGLLAKTNRPRLSIEQMNEITQGPGQKA